MVRGSSALEMEQERRRRRLALASAGSSIALAAPTSPVASATIATPLKPIVPPMTPEEVGHDYGKRLIGDPYRLAEGLGVTLKVCTEAQICTVSGVTRRPGNALQGAANKTTKAVYVNSTLSRWAKRGTLAHECGHVMHPEWAEEQVTAFAEAFMTHSPTTDMNEEEKRKAHWRAMFWTSPQQSTLVRSK